MAHAAACATSRICFVIDGPHVERKVGVLRGGAPMVGKHQDLWSVVRRVIHKVVGISWVKAHLLDKTAADRGIPRGLWALDLRADKQATQGVWRTRGLMPFLGLPWQSGVRVAEVSRGLLQGVSGRYRTWGT